MIDQADRRLLDWVKSVLPTTDVTLQPPGNPSSSPCINLYLLDLLQSPPSRSNRRPPLQVVLRYLVTSHAQDAEAAHKQLGDLLFAGMEHAEYEVDLEPLPPAVWASFGIAPQPAFMLKVLLQRERPEPEVKYVTSPLVLTGAPITTVYGIVLGPGDVPIMGAHVEYPTLNRSVYTDAHGRFRLPGVPGTSVPKELRVTAKGYEQRVTANQATSESDPVVIRYAKMED